VIAEIKDAPRLFHTNPANPSGLIVLEGEHTDPTQIAAYFDVNGWCVACLDFSKPQERQVMAQLTNLVSSADLIYCVIERVSEKLLDTGYIMGLAKSAHKPVFIDYRGDASQNEYPNVFRLADGIGFGVDDLTLFVDRFANLTELSELSTRARSVANQIKRVRMS
jgi:hypothetical protein